MNKCGQCGEGHNISVNQYPKNRTDVTQNIFFVFLTSIPTYFQKDENDLALALSEVNQDFHGALDARALRQILVKNGKPPVLFVLNELQSLLQR